MSSLSPFVSALPASAVMHQYDADGDAIMTDAVTGLPITYGSGSKRARSGSLDSDSADSRPSKRSRSSSDDGAADGSGRPSPIRTPRAPVGIPADVCPPAPKKVSPPPLPPSDDDDDDDDDSVTRNLAEQMAEAVLAGEPQSPVAPAAPLPSASASNAAAEPPPGGDAPGGEAPGGEPEQADYCVSVTCSDLALRLDMRHPRVVLALLRFVDLYNELAPPGEEIHLPYMDTEASDNILNHSSVTNPPAEFVADVNELVQRVRDQSCQCPDCAPDNWSDSDHDEDSHGYGSD